MSNNKPVNSFYYSEQEWNRLGCGPLPEERKHNKQKDFSLQQKSDIMARGNPATDNNVIKGYN